MATNPRITSPITVPAKTYGANPPRILTVPDETQKPTGLHYSSSDKDFEESLRMMEMQKSKQQTHQNIPEANDPEDFDPSELQEADPRLIRQRMAQFANQPLPEGARVLTQKEFKEFQDHKEEIKKQNKIVPLARKERALALAGIGRKRDKLAIENHTFHLRTLTDADEEQIAALIYRKIAEKAYPSDIEYAKDKQRGHLALAIEKIEFPNEGEVEFGKFMSETFGQDNLELRIEFIKEFDYHAVTKPLYEKFAELTVGISIQSKEEAKEVAVDIKK